MLASRSWDLLRNGDHFPSHGAIAALPVRDSDGREGGKALEQYGQDNWVTYCFTAGGTVLNALGSEPVPYLEVLKMAAENMGPSPHKL